MKATLVTTCWNEKSSVAHWLSDVFQQTCQPDEIIIIDNFSSDGTHECLLEHAERVTVLQKKCTVAQGRNEAIRRARNTIIVSTDMGTRLAPDWFENIVAKFDEDPDLDVVAGNYEYVYPTKNGLSRAEYYYKNRGRAKMVPGFLPSSRNIAYKKSVWERIGGYQECLTNATDDTIFAHEIHAHGFRVVFAPDSLVYWNRHEKLADYLKETSRYGFGNGEARIKSPILTRHSHSKMYPVWKAYYAMYSLYRSGKAILSALKSHDYTMLFFIPYFVILNSLEYAEFYRKGYLLEKDSLRGLRDRIKQLGLS